MMNLTDEQRQALETEPFPRLVDPVTQTEYVLIRAESYEKLRRLLESEEVDPSFFEVEELELFDE